MSWEVLVALALGFGLGYLIAWKTMTWRMVPHLDKARQELIARENAVRRRELDAPKLSGLEFMVGSLERERDALQRQVHHLTGEPYKRQVRDAAERLAGLLGQPGVTRLLSPPHPEREAERE